MSELNYLNIIQYLKTTLKDFNYVILTPGFTRHELPIIKIGLPSTDRTAFLKKLRTNFDFQVVQTKLDVTTLTIDLSNNTLVTIEIFHFFHSDRLTYLNIKEVLANKKYASKGFYIPSWEHLLEFNILHHFLNEEGINELFIKQFEDLHIFLQEGLLDYFNTKYDTFFANLYELRDYKETIEQHFRKQLKQFPANKFSNRIKLGWINVKSLLKRSAAFSFLH